MGLDESSVRSCSASLTSISWGFVGKTFIQPLKNECIYPTKTRISISWGKPEQTFLQLWLAGGWGTILMPLFHQHHPPATGWEPDLAPCPAVLVPGRLRLPLDFFFFAESCQLRDAVLLVDVNWIVTNTQSAALPGDWNQCSHVLKQNYFPLAPLLSDVILKGLHIL